MTEVKYYTGVGSQSTPEDVLEMMEAIANMLQQAGYILRSGHADGADLAFEYGAKGKADIYLPWGSFNNDAPLKGNAIVGAYSIQSEDLAMKHHPAWQVCSDGAKRLLNRDGYQVLGLDLKTPSKFLICWTKGGKGGGGTGQSIRIANAYGIPVFDLGSATGLKHLLEFGTTL